MTQHHPSVLHRPATREARRRTTREPADAGRVERFVQALGILLIAVMAVGSVAEPADASVSALAQAGEVPAVVLAGAPAPQDPPDMLGPPLLRAPVPHPVRLQPHAPSAPQLVGPCRLEPPARAPPVHQHG